MRTGSRPGAVRTALLVVLVVALAALAVQQLRLRSQHRGLISGRSGTAQLSGAENAAVSAAKAEVIKLQTVRRKTFDADFAAAAAGMTSQYAIQYQANRTDLKTELTRIKRDTGGTVSGAGLVSLSGSTAVVLVSADLKRIDDNGTSTTYSQNRYQVTMKRVNGRWLMDSLNSVGF